MERLNDGLIIGRFMYEKEREEKTIRIRDLIILEKANLITRDQIYMVLTKKAYKSEQRALQWVFSNWKQGEYNG